ncbi:MAG: DUF5652 family protein [Patescibacteria group bacterium]|nr:DUF5652 family protein [Patescibacteria group bacterium]
MELLTSSVQTNTVVPTWVLLLIMLWVLPWKGYSLWLASRNSHKKWFIVLLVINTLAILDIIYIFFISKRKK